MGRDPARARDRGVRWRRGQRKASCPRRNFSRCPPVETKRSPIDPWSPELFCRPVCLSFCCCCSCSPPPRGRTGFRDADRRPQRRHRRGRQRRPGRDGAGAVAYLRKDGGVTHAFIARLIGGGWRGPSGSTRRPARATEVKVAVGDGNRIAVAWIADGNVYANVAPGGTPDPGGFAGPAQLGGPGAKGIDIDLGVNGAAYVTWQQGGNVHAARLQDSTWRSCRSRWTSTSRSTPAPACSSRRSPSRPRATRSSPGATTLPAARACGRAGSPGSTSRSRRCCSTCPRAATPTRRTSTSRTIGRSRTVVFRQDVGVSRTVGRRLVGSTFEVQEAIDANLSSDTPKSADGRRRCRLRGRAEPVGRQRRRLLALA